MIKLQAQSLANLVYYKKADLRFTKGVTCVLGDNQNARTRGANNGAGKSSLFIPLHSALGYATPLTKGRQGSKDIFGKTSEASLTFKRGPHSYTSLRRGNKYTITRDGIDLGLRTQALALQKLEALRGLTETQFYATVYLDSSKAHAFQSGSSTDRINFFTELFGLHDIDNVKAYCRGLLVEAQDTEKDIQRIRADLRDITEVDTTETQARYDKLVAVQDKCQTMLRRFVGIRHMADLWERHLRLESEKKELVDAIGTYTLASVKTKRKAIKEHDSQIAELQSWKTRKRKLLTGIRELQADLGALSLKAAKAKIRGWQVIADLEQPDKPGTKRSPKLIAKLEKMLGTMPEARHTKVLLKKEAQLAGKSKDIQETLDTLEEHEVADGKSHSSCPLCKTKLEARHFDLMLESLSEEQQRLDRKLGVARDLRKALEVELLWRTYEEDYAKYESSTKGFSEKAYKDLQRYVENLHAFKRVEDSQPEVTELQGDETEEQLDALYEQLTRLKTLHEQPGLPNETESELRGFANANSLPFDAAVLRTFVMDAEERRVAQLRKVNEQVPTLRSQLDRASADSKRAAKLRRELREKKADTKDLPVLKMLVEAYSKAGVKSLIVKRRARQIEKNLNLVAPTMLREPMKFELVVEGSNFFVLAHRMNMGKPIVSDVRTLSGAERRMFILLFLMATLPLLPSSKRYDTLVLDEPFANLDEPSVEMLRDRLLPKLSQVVPKLVLIVTSPKHVPHGARIVTAVKRNNVSTLELGAPK